MKISISVLNFSTESAEKPTIYDLLFCIVIYSLKNDNKHLSEMKEHQSSHFTMSKVSVGLGPILTTGLKC